jgi:hypothetical protein
MNDHIQTIVGARGGEKMNNAGSDGEKITGRRVPGGGWYFDALMEQSKKWWGKWRRFASRPRKKVADDWRQWSRFRLWRRTRPFWGSLLIIIAGLLVLWGPIEFLPFAMLPGNSVWAGILVGALLLVMGIIQLLAPSYALITGAIAIVLSLVSLLVAVGGLGIGMILGLIGGAIGVSWRPVVGALKGPTYRRVASTTARPIVRKREVVKSGSADHSKGGPEISSIGVQAVQQASGRSPMEPAGEQINVVVTPDVEASSPQQGVADEQANVASIPHVERVQEGRGTTARGPKKTRIIRQNTEENRRS